MEQEKKKALLDLIKECDDVEYLIQIEKTIHAIIDALEKTNEAKRIMGVID